MADESGRAAYDDDVADGRADQGGRRTSETTPPLPEAFSMVSALTAADARVRARTALALQRTHGNAYVARLVRQARPGLGPTTTRVLARTPTADQSRWLQIFFERRAADPLTAYAQTLIQAFVDNHISGSSVKDRFNAILALTSASPRLAMSPEAHFNQDTIMAIGTERPGPGPVAVGFRQSDFGFRRELRDSIQYQRDARGQDVPLHPASSNQIGHFLTAAHIGFFIADYEAYYAQRDRDLQAHWYSRLVMPSETDDQRLTYETLGHAALTAAVGHELSADDGTASALMAASPADVTNFQRDRLDLIRVNDNQPGDSYQDLLLTWVGYRFGRRVADGAFPSRQEAARWLTLMLTESNLGGVTSNDRFSADARDMERMLTQFRAIQQRIHPAPQPAAPPTTAPGPGP